MRLAHFDLLVNELEIPLVYYDESNARKNKLIRFLRNKMTNFLIVCTNVICMHKENRIRYGIDYFLSHGFCPLFPILQKICFRSVQDQPVT